MTDSLLNDRDLHFQLFEVLDTQELVHRARYADHDLNVFQATINTARQLAEHYFLPHYAKADAEEPSFDGERVRLIPETKKAWDAFADAGFLAAHHDYEIGGLQLPEVVLRSCMAYFMAANASTAGYSFLTIGAANLLRSFGSQALQQRYLESMLNGKCSGTMALTEPSQGSALGDLKTLARASDDGTYRIVGQKMFISGGDHDLTDNIVHMVLARIEGAPAGVRGISLFLVPKNLVNDAGVVTERNDVALTGLLHKMGYRNTTSTALNFGEEGGAIGYLVGEANKGLAYMFQMMNEARIGVGLGAACLGYQSYIHALAYAKDRPQGRLPGDKDPLSPQVNIIEHADVRRMLLQQKAYAEGSFSLCLFASSLFEDSRTGTTEQQRCDADELLDLLTPVVKTYSSRYGVIASDIGIQVLGGAGYTREYPLEQLYRDNRLNPIHEGTEGIQGIDLLSRKLGPKGGKGYELFVQAIKRCLEEANAKPGCEAMSTSLSAALNVLDEVTRALQQQVNNDPIAGLSNATPYLDLFGRVVVGWIWLRQALVATNAITQGAHGSDISFYAGKLHTAQYFMQWELADLPGLAALLVGSDRIVHDMQKDWF